MRYVIFAVLIILALVALMPVLVSMSRHLLKYFNSTMTYEQDIENISEPINEKIEEKENGKNA